MPLSFLDKLRHLFFGTTIAVGPFYIGERRGKMVMMAEYDLERENALDVLEKHNIRAQLYLPAIHIKDRELMDALRLLHSRGYIMTDKHGGLIGIVTPARLTADENARQRRAGFKVIKTQDDDADSAVTN